MTPNHLQNRPDTPDTAGSAHVTISGRLSDWLNRRRYLVGYGIMIVSAWFLIPALMAGIQGDIRLYQGVAQDFIAGKMPYRDRVLEYPPYAIPFFLLPRILGGESYFVAFAILVLLADWGIKLLLFDLGIRSSQTPRSLLPLAFYCAAIPFLQFFFLQRYDVFPALTCLLAVWFFCSGRPLLCGLAIALGIGIKLYPIVFVPPLFVLAFRQKAWQRFFIGLIIGLVPMVFLGLYLPWWRFAEFQAARGLQVESLYASVLWLGKQLGVAQLNWDYTKGWFEVSGPGATAVLPWARVLFVGATAIAVALAVWAAARTPIASAGGNGVKTAGFSVPQLGRLLLLPLLGFVAFNQVLSPQYMIWLLPLAVLAALDGDFWVVSAIVLAAMLTPLIFPSLHGDYYNGLNLFETMALVLRNLLLVGVAGKLSIFWLRSISHKAGVPVA